MSPPNSNNAFRFSTEHYGERDRLSAWRDIFGRTVVGLDIDPLTPERFRSEATMRVSRSRKTSAVHLSHSSGLIVDDDLSFAVAPAERWTATQLGRTAALGRAMASSCGMALLDR